MRTLEQLYNNSLALLTDLYQLTMAYAYWKSGTAQKEAVFHLSFRENPYDGGFAVGCGLGHVVGVLTRFGFEASDLEYLSQLRGNDGQPLFEDAFLDYLRDCRFACDVDAIPEGTVVFPHEPLVRIRGPILQGQILETVLLNILCFQTLIATKAARVCQSARGEPVLEFGLRRAQGFDGALAASRAAYVGGCAGDLQRPRRQAFRHPGEGHPRPQLGAVLRRRDGGLRDLRRGHAQQLPPAGGHLRQPERRPQGGGDRPQAAGAGPRDGGASGWIPETWRFSASRRARSWTGAVSRTPSSSAATTSTST